MNFPPSLIPLLRQTLRHDSAPNSSLIVLTGAGVSQESGLRTFRDAHPSSGSGQAGLWAQYKPEELASPEAFRKNPKLIWDWYAWRREAIKGARPNPGHYALAELEKRIPHFTLITQNVDGLHRMAGSLNILELHGNIQRVRCSECATFAETWGDDSEVVPRCEVCGGLLRPDVVWFGEALPRNQLEAAVEAARSCDIFISIGTSGVVQPAASLPFAAHNRGAKVIEINLEPTPLTPKVDYFLQGKSGELLPALVEAVWN